MSADMTISAVAERLGADPREVMRTVSALCGEHGPKNIVALAEPWESQRQSILTELAETLIAEALSVQPAVTA